MTKKQIKEVDRIWFAITCGYLLSFAFLIWAGISLSWLRFFIGIIFFTVISIIAYAITETNKETSR